MELPRVLLIMLCLYIYQVTTMALPQHLSSSVKPKSAAVTTKPAVTKSQSTRPVTLKSSTSKSSKPLTSLSSTRTTSRSLRLPYPSASITSAVNTPARSLTVKASSHKSSVALSATHLSLLSSNHRSSSLTPLANSHVASHKVLPSQSSGGHSYASSLRPSASISLYPIDPSIPDATVLTYPGPAPSGVVKVPMVDAVPLPATLDDESADFYNDTVPQAQSSSGNATSTVKRGNIPSMLRENYRLFHGTCESDYKKIHDEGLSLPSQRGTVREGGDEFSYKGGFYLTPQEANAARFTIAFKKCAPGTFVVVEYILRTSGLKEKDVGMEEPDGPRSKCVKFWKTQINIGLYILHGMALPKDLLKAKDKLDRIDYVKGTKNILPDNDRPNGPKDPFNQLVIVSPRGLAGLDFVRKYTVDEHNPPPPPESVF